MNSTIKHLKRCRPLFYFSKLLYNLVDFSVSSVKIESEEVILTMKNVGVKVEKGNITMKQIAKQLGVSIQTVNYWLNAIDMDQVKEARILAAIKVIKEQSKK